jgi:hypothetical protein
MTSNVIQRLIVNEIKETMVSPVYNTTTFSGLDSCTFYVTYNPGTTINLTNIQLANDGIISITFISPLGAMAMPTLVTVNGATFTVRWANGVIPTANPNNIVLLTLSIITVNGVIAHVIGGKSNFN